MTGTRDGWRSSQSILHKLSRSALSLQAWVYTTQPSMESLRRFAPRSAVSAASTSEWVRLPPATATLKSVSTHLLLLEAIAHVLTKAGWPGSLPTPAALVKSFYE